MFEPFGWQHLVPLAEGAWVTLQLVAVSAVAGSFLGILLGLGETSPIRVVRWVTMIYVNIIRGIPFLVLIFFAYFGLPLVIPGSGLPPFMTAVIALTVWASAYTAEIVRGSIDAIPKGQMEAAEALGLNYFSKYRHVIIPQAMRIVVPPGTGFLIGLVKESSLVTVIGFIELARAGSVVSNITQDPITTYLVVAAMYFVMCYGISLLGRFYEKRTSVSVNPLRQPQNKILELGRKK